MKKIFNFSIENSFFKSEYSDIKLFLNYTSKLQVVILLYQLSGRDTYITDMNICICKSVTPMREDLLEVIAILDMSGSMGGIQSDTIGGFNAYLDQLKSNPDFETLMTLVFFNNTNQTIFYRKNVKEIGHITTKEYCPGGGTALLDALGFSIERLRTELSQTAEDQKPGQVSFFVTTDGEENSSKRFDNQKIKKMVEQA